MALVEVFITDNDSTPRVRRLHLIAVDLNRRQRFAARVFFCLDAAWLNVTVVSAVALLSATNK